MVVQIKTDFMIVEILFMLAKRVIMIFQLFGLDGRKKRLQKVRPVYDLLIKAARNPYFYEKLKVPDTLSGRFDMIVLHQFILFYRLKAEKEPQAKEFGQDVFDIFIEDMDRSLREMGVGYQAVPKRMKNMGEAFYGRVAVYDAAMENKDKKALQEAIRRNLFTDIDVEDETISTLSDYFFQNIEKMALLSFENLCQAQFSFTDFSMEIE